MSEITTGGGGGSADQQALYDQKRKTMDMVRSRFARYGDQVLSVVLGYALQSRRLPQLLDRVGAATAAGATMQEQLDNLAAQIAVMGPTVFLGRALHRRKDEVKPVDVDALESRLDPAGEVDAGPGVLVSEATMEAISRLRDAIRDSVPAETLREPVPSAFPAPAASPPFAAPVSARVPAPSSAAAPEVQPEAAPPPADLSGRPRIEVPGYSGPDRRSGCDRRNKPDRRLGIAAIPKNRRWGPDRRLNLKGRRKEDQARPARWWNQIKPGEDGRPAQSVQHSTPVAGVLPLPPGAAKQGSLSGVVTGEAALRPIPRLSPGKED